MNINFNEKSAPLYIILFVLGFGGSSMLNDILPGKQLHTLTEQVSDLKQVVEKNTEIAVDLKTTIDNEKVDKIVYYTEYTEEGVYVEIQKRANKILNDPLDVKVETIKFFANTCMDLETQPSMIDGALAIKYNFYNNCEVLHNYLLKGQ